MFFGNEDYELSRDLLSSQRGEEGEEDSQIRAFENQTLSCQKPESVVYFSETSGDRSGGLEVLREVYN